MRAVRACCVIVAAVGACRTSETAAGRAWELADADVIRFDLDSTFHGTRDVIVDGSGESWYLTSYSPNLTHYGVDGRIRSRSGRRGRGPGELGNPVALSWMDTKSFVVWDVRNRKLIRFDGAGAVIDEHALSLRNGTIRSDIEELTFGRPFQIRSIGTGLVFAEYPAGLTRPSDFATLQLVWLQPGSEVRRVIYEHTPSEQWRVVNRPVDLGEIPLWTTCPDDEIVVFEPEPGRILRFSVLNDRRHVTFPAVPRRPLADDDIVAYLRQSLLTEMSREAIESDEGTALINRLVRRRDQTFPTYAPRAVGMLCDDGGRVWLQQFSAAVDGRGFGNEWLLIDRHSAVGVIQFPKGFRVFAISPDRAIGIMEDEMGTQAPAVVSLPAALVLDSSHDPKPEEES